MGRSFHPFDRRPRGSLERSPIANLPSGWRSGRAGRAVEPRQPPPRYGPGPLHPVLDERYGTHQVRGYGANQVRGYGPRPLHPAGFACDTSNGWHVHRFSAPHTLRDRRRRRRLGDAASAPLAKYRRVHRIRTSTAGAARQSRPSQTEGWPRDACGLQPEAHARHRVTRISGPGLYA